MIDTAGWSLKRLAWAYGCAPKDSDEERELCMALVAKASSVARIHEQERLAVESGWVEIP